MYLATDIGNVIYHIDMKNISITIYNLLEKYHNYTYIGLMNYEDILEKYYEQNEGVKSFKLMLKEWNKSIYPNNCMVSFLKKLKENDVKIALLSNIGKEHSELIRENKELMNIIDVCHFSNEVGAFKPQKLFFQSFIMQHPEYKGCIYLDDIIENVNMSKLLGFNGIQFELDSFKDEIQLNSWLEEIESRIVQF